MVLRLRVSALATVLVGCGTPSPSISAPAAPVPEASASPGEPTASASAPSASELPGGPDPIPAGRYTRAAFRPPLTFEIEEGWFVGSVVDGFFDVQQLQDTPDVIAVQFAVVEGVVGAGSAVAPASTAADAAQAIGANPGLVGLAESESRLGGLTGYNLEVENQGTDHVQIIDVPAGMLGIDPGRRLWIALFDTSDGLLAVMVGGSVADWDHALAVAEPVLESIVIGESLGLARG